MSFPFARTILTVCISTIAFATHASDGVRSMSMGGASVTAGLSAEGAFSNPALLLKERRSGRKFGFQLGSGAELRDSASLIEEIEDNQTLVDDIDREINNLTSRTLQCNPSSTDLSQVCLTGVGELGGLVLEFDQFLRDADSEPVDFRFTGNIAAVWPMAQVPLGVSFGMRGTVSGLVDIEGSDQDYTSGLTAAFEDGTLTLQEINDYAAISIDPADSTISIEQLDDELSSEARGTAVARAVLAASLAHQFNIGGREIDLGITPRLSKISASSVIESLSQDDDNNSDFEENQTDETSFTFDVGAAYSVPEKAGLTIGGVIRNLIPESVQTRDGFKVESTPQLILSALYEQPGYLVTADVALNEGTYDNYDTQVISVGGELIRGIVKFRTGLSADLSIDKPLALSLGVGVGVVDFGVRLSGASAAFGLQIAY